MFRHVEFALVSTLFAAQFAAAADLPKEGDFKLTFHVITESRRSIPMPEGQFANLNLETLEHFQAWWNQNGSSETGLICDSWVSGWV